MIDLNFISKIALEYSKAREKNRSVEKGSPLNLLKHCSGEIIEAQNARDKWIYGGGDFDSVEKQEYAAELADVVMCILITSASDNIDIEEALKDCLEKNRKRAEI